MAGAVVSQGDLFRVSVAVSVLVDRPGLEDREGWGVPSDGTAG